ncbi:unnamed protein product [Rhizoctonia solani]|uniref:Uncharacterized protein n=1 Tax=Rhizoctonia solani TaxID=456999 RepID=A0A8H3CQR9_9AGAM|nr:unnamed protein product [Rhizoctonia solani]
MPGQCPVRRVPRVQSLRDGFEARHVGYILAALFTLVSVVASVWLVQHHLRWYSCARPFPTLTANIQKDIIRLLFLVPIYASITLASYVSVSNAISLLLVRDAYEAVAVASFFWLLLEYVAGPRHPDPDRDEPERERLAEDTVEHVHSPLTKDERRTVVHKVFYRLAMHPGVSPPSPPSTSTDVTDPQTTHALKWIFPLNSVRARPRDGLSYLHWMKWGVWQYCIIRPGSTLAAVVLQQLGLYCEPSWSWRWGHVYVVTIASVSVTVAMYCLAQLYTTISAELRPYKPMIKLFALYAVVFLTFWQEALLSGIASLNLIQDTEYLTAQDIVVGFTALLQTFEMMCLAFLHIKAFSYVPYRHIAHVRSGGTSTGERNPYMILSPPAYPARPTRQVQNLVHVFALGDLWTAGWFGREADVCRREERFREVFGRDRERSFMRISGYKEDKYMRIGGLRYSPLPTPPQDEDDSAPMSLLKTRESDDTVREYHPIQDPAGEYVAPRLDYATSVLRDYAAQNAPAERERAAPAPPPRGAYVPAHGPGPSLAWSGDGVITPPRTPVFVSPLGDGSSGGASYLPVEPSNAPGVGSSSTPNVPPTTFTSSPPPQTQAPVKGSRRIGDVYVGGTRGGEFAREPRMMGMFTPASPVSPQAVGSPVSPRQVGSPVSPRQVGTPVSARSVGTPNSARSGGYPPPRHEAYPPRHEGAYASRPGGHPPQPGGIPTLPQPKGPSLLQPKGPSRSAGTHISPHSAQMLAQTSPLFQLSFAPDAQAYPLSPVSPPAVRVSRDFAPRASVNFVPRASTDLAPPRTSEDLVPRASGETQRTQRNSGFTLPHWASGTPTHSQWPSNVTSSRRTSAYTMDPPSPTRAIPEESEPSSSRDDSLLVRVFSAATRTTDSRESAEAETSMLSLRTGDALSSNDSDEACVQLVRSVSFRAGAPVLVRLGERRDSISSPSLVSSNSANRRVSDPSTPSSASSRPEPGSIFPSASLPSPPEIARPLRRVSAGLQLRVPRGPRAQPRTVTFPAPLSPARYPHSPWRPTITRPLGHVSSVHATVSHWNPLRPPSPSLANNGRAGRSSEPEYTAMSSLSSLSNTEEPRRDS